MLAQSYAQALYDLKGQISAEAFLTLLKKRGHEALLPKIIAHYEALVANIAESRPTVRVCRSRDAEAFAREIAEFAGTNARIIEDPAIVGGYVIEREDTVIDGSHRRKLLKMFQQLRSVPIEHS